MDNVTLPEEAAMLISPDNAYTKGEVAFYNKAKAAQMAKTDHRHHDENPDYDKFFLSPVRRTSRKFKGSAALDFGCGTGRNIDNLLKLGKFARVDGVDVSEPVLDQATKRLMNAGHAIGEDFSLWLTNGVDLTDIESDQYKYVMSTIVLQHIPVYEIRFQLLSEMFRVMEDGGELTIQLGFGPGYGKSDYHANNYDADGYNTQHDVIILNEQDVIDDLEKIGFTKVKTFIRKSFSDGHPNWLFVTCKK